jgi:hypothetical protein
MKSQQFLAKQRVKYYWKALKHTTRLDNTTFNDDGEESTTDSFWEYEQTPRSI